MKTSVNLQENCRTVVGGCAYGGGRIHTQVDLRTIKSSAHIVFFGGFSDFTAQFFGIQRRIADMLGGGRWYLPVHSWAIHPSGCSGLGGSDRYRDRFHWSRRSGS